MSTIPHRRPGVKKQSQRGRGGCQGSSGRAHQARNRERNRNWQRLVAKRASTDLDATARAQAAILRKRKVQAGEDLLRLAMAYALTDKGLREVAAWAAEVGLAFLSAEGVRKRLKRSNTWVAHLVALHLLCSQPAEGALPELRVVIQDATFISVRGSKGVSHRVHVVMDLATERITQVEVTDVKGGETLERFPFSPGDLVIGDRIYGTRYSIAAVVGAGAHVLVRLRWNVPLLDGDGKPVNLVAEARQCPEDGPREVRVWTPADDKEGVPAIEARVVIARRSEQAAEKARRDLRREAKKKGYTPSEDALEAQGYLFVLTTVSAEVLPAKMVLALYRLRWRVEICFKRHKSVLGLDELRAKEGPLAETVLYTKILAALWEGEALWQWEQGFLSEVPDPEAVMVPRWRMMRLLRDGLLDAVGVAVSMEEWEEAPAEVNRRLIEPARKRTRERNARLKAALESVAGASVGP